MGVGPLRIDSIYVHTVRYGQSARRISWQHGRQGRHMDGKLFRLLLEFSCQLATTKPSDLDTLGLRYMQGAYELGKAVGRAEVKADQTATNYQWDTDGSENGGESGEGM
jgi:hypothetical protein